jgi:hypothetical protein
MDRDKRGAEAAYQRRLALASCRAALALPKATDAEREQARTCLSDPAAAGAK